MKKMHQGLAILLTVLLLIASIPLFPVSAAQPQRGNLVETPEEAVLPDIPDGFHFSNFSYMGPNGVLYYYIETAPSKYGDIFGYWIDQTGRRLQLQELPLAQAEPDVSTRKTFASSYDARDEGLITPVEYQTGGTCWAHAACAIMEANAIKKGYADNTSIDFDEYYLAWFARNSYNENETGSRYDGSISCNWDDGSVDEDLSEVLDGGGTYVYVAAATQNFTGPVLESRYNIRRNNKGKEDKAVLLANMQSTFTPQTRFQYDYVNTKIHVLSYAVDNVKAALLKYGAVQVSYFSDSNYYTSNWNYGQPATCAYYYPEAHKTNHAVTVVGWDDDYPVENFKEGVRPSSNGAWLVKNSWSTNWGENGYFWLSYEDPTLSSGNEPCTYEVELASEYPHVYSYNGNLYGGAKSDYFHYSQFSKIANVFTATGAQSLKQVCAGVVYWYGDYNYTFYIYKNLPADYSSPEDGTLAYTQSGKAVDDIRFIDVEGDVTLEEGEIFSVVFKINSGGILYEGLSTDINKFFSQPGESYYYANNQWNDANENERNNFYVQAVTEDITDGPYKVTFACPGYYSETRTAENGTVTLPSTADHTWTFTYNGEAFDGTGVTKNMTVRSHCYPNAGTVKPGAPCTTQYKCIYCGEQIIPEVTQHSYVPVVTPATPADPGFTTYTCAVCGDSYVSDYTLYDGAVGGIENGFTWQIVDGTLYVSGSGTLPNYTKNNPAPWKAYDSEITALVVGEDITAIGAYDFYQLPALTSASLPETLTAIGNYAFQEDTLLSAVNMPSGLTTIGNYAFSKTALVSFTAPTTLRSLGTYAFQNATALESVDLRGCAVTALSNYMFSGATALQTVYPPEGLQTIGTNTFQYCESLQSFTAPATLTSIGSSAFRGCKALETFSCSDGIETINANTFNGCQALQSFTAPSTLKTIGDSAFSGAIALETLTLNNGLQTIGANAFTNASALKTLIVPASVESIGSSAFLGAALLETVQLPDSLTTLSSSVFSGTTALRSFTAPAQLLSVGSRAFYNSGLETIQWNAKLQDIGDYAFYNTKMETLTLPATVESVGKYAFANMANLTDIQFNAALTTLGEYAFSNAAALETAVLPGTLTGYGKNIFNGCTAMKTLRIENGITALDEPLFSSASKLETIQLPASVASISPLFFSGSMSKLTAVTVDEENTAYCAEDGVLYNKAKTLLCVYPQGKTEHCYAAPGTVSAVQAYAFKSNTNLRYIDLSATGISVLPTNAFNASYVRNLNLPQTLTTIEEKALLFNTSYLSKLFVPATVTNLPSGNIFGTRIPTIYTDNANAAIIAYAAENDITCNVLDAHSHAFTNTLENTAATCAQTGLLVKGCACGNFTYTLREKTQEHTKTNPVVTEPTCTAGGYTTYTCGVCGLTYQADAVESLGHDYEWVIDTPATCGAPGEKHEECSRCDATRSMNTEIPATGEHDFEWVIDTPATCGTAGEKHEKCANCDATRSMHTEIPATGAHDFEWVIDTPATCGTPGAKHEKCANCDATRSLNTVIPATGAHTFTKQDASEAALKSAATCTTAATYYYTCNVCGAIEGSNSHTFTVGSALGHDYEWVIDTPATCGAAGEKHEKCSRCDATRSLNTEIPATGAHTFTKQDASEAALKSAATCTTAATYYYTCNGCGAIEGNNNHTFTVGGALGHDYEWVIDTPATCGTAGVKHEKCSRCDATRSLNTAIPATGDHTFTKQDASTAALKSAATCTAAATYYYTCNVCGAIEGSNSHTFTVGSALGHDYEWVIDTPATCGTAGEKHEKCSRCDATRSLNTAIPATGDHTFTKRDASTAALKSAATCTAAATYYYTCDVCGTVERSNSHTFTAGNALGHDYEWVIDTPATCGTAGEKHEKCSRCDATRSLNTTIPATGAHTYEWVIDTPATCGTAGEKHEKCTGCGATRSLNTEIPATGAHTFTKQDASAAALKSEVSCTTAATYYYTCNVCGAIERSNSHTFTVGNALGHDYEWVIDTPETCGTAGVKHEKCSRCNATRSMNTTIPATGAHTFAKQDASTAALKSAATCTAAATYYYTCNGCGVIEKNNSHTFTAGNALGHDYTGALRRNNDGTHARACKNGCGTYGAAEACTYSLTASVAGPNCQTGGTDTYTCACGNSYTQPNGKTGAHQFSGGSCTLCGAADPHFNPALSCSCDCHSNSFFTKLIWNIKVFFWKIFHVDSNRQCACGNMHW